MFNIYSVNVHELNPPVGHYSHAVCANGLIFISGLLPITKRGDKVNGFDAQVKQVFKNLDHVLSESKSDKNQLVQVRVYITDIKQWSQFNKLYAQWIGSHRPARCVVPVPVLHYDSSLEIEAVAHQSSYARNLISSMFSV